MTRSSPLAASDTPLYMRWLSYYTGLDDEHSRRCHEEEVVKEISYVGIEENACKDYLWHVPAARRNRKQIHNLEKRVCEISYFSSLVP